MWGGALGEVDKWEEWYKRQVQFASLAGADWHIGPCASVAEQFDVAVINNILNKMKNTY